MSELFETTHDVLIAGSGPAGLTAAIYAARANLNPVMVEGEAAGGQLVDTTEVENYPGFPEGILGPDLINVMKQQAERFGTRVVTDHIESCDLSKRPFTLQLRSGKALKAKTLIISTGASARWLGLESESRLKGHGVTACATCDGFFFKGKEVAVIGGGDTAMEEATFLTKFCSKVTVIHRRGELRASKIMQERAFNNPKIAFKWNSVVEEVHDVSQNRVTGLKLRNTVDNTTEDFACEGLFLAIGHDPNTGFLKGQVRIDEHGFVVVEHPTTRTSVPGVFACGDVMDPIYKQAVTAAGTGCRAAIDAERFLEAEKG